MISIIIPTLNESENIVPLITSIFNYKKGAIEVIVCDGGSSDDTVQVAKAAGATVFIAPQKGRAAQMNFGAKNANGSILYFVHADVKLNPDFEQDIYQAINEGFSLGCYRYQFDSKKILLKINAFFTRFDKIWCRGGDQTLFVKRTCFERLGGYRDHFKIMEDYDFISRARKEFKFKIIPKNVIVSARKYDTNSYLKVQLANLKIMRMWKKGASHTEMADTYQKLLDYR